MYLQNNLTIISVRSLFSRLLIIITIILTGCGAGGGNTESKTGVLAPSSIAINPANNVTVSKGLTAAFTAIASYADNSTADITNQVNWASASTSIATITSSTGVATGVEAGSTAITASLSGVTSPTTTLTVTTATLTGITINPTAPSTPHGTPVTFTATGTYTDTTTANVSGSVTWSSSNTAVASLNASGIASSLAQGTSTISASANGITSNSAPLTVTAPVLASISVSPATIGTKVGTPVNYTATGTYTNGSTSNITSSVTWASSNAGAATINSSGVATPVALGNSTISAAMGGNTSNNATMAVRNLLGGTMQGVPLTLSATVSTFAGSGVAGAIDGTGTAATFFAPTGITSDGTNIFVVNGGNHIIRKIVIATGVVTTLAGSSTAGSVDGTGTAAKFYYPIGIATDGVNLYVADSANQNIRKIIIATGVVTTLAGTGVTGSANGTGTSASFFSPSGITTDGINLYVTDTGNHIIRKIVIATGVVTTLAGSGSAGAIDATGTAASFKNPWGIAMDGTNIYIGDWNNYKIRKINIGTGVVTTLAGSGVFGSVDGTGTAALLSRVTGITTDGTNLYLADYDNNKIRRVVIATGVVTTLAGTGFQGAVDDIGTSASFKVPHGITSDGTHLFVSDHSNQKIRKIQ